MKYGEKAPSGRVALYDFGLNALLVSSFLLN